MKKPETLKYILLEDAEKTYSLTKRLFYRVADSELQWKPPLGRNWMTLSQLLMHCASYGCGKAVKGFVRGDWGIPEGTEGDDLESIDHIPEAEKLPAVESVEQGLRVLEDDRILTRSCIEEIKEDDLLTKKLTAPWGGDEMTLFRHLLLMVEHLKQHKGQLFYYLKLMGRDVGTRDLWGE